jgi:hypothetical protein
MSTMTNQLLVSRRAAEVVKRLRIQEGWQSFQCAVVTAEQEVLLDGECFHIPKWLDLLDEGRSEFKVMRHGGRGPVTRAVLKRAMVEKYDLCKDPFLQPFVCSENLVEAVNRHRLTGFKFDELECVD